MICLANPLNPAERLVCEVFEELRAELKGFKCSYATLPELLSLQRNKIWLLDAARVERVKLIGANQIKYCKIFSSHELQPLSLGKAKLIGVPVRGDKERIKAAIKRFLRA